MNNIKKFNELNESYTDEEVHQIGIELKEFNELISNLNYDGLIEYCDISGQFNMMEILEYLKKKSRYI